MGKKSHLSTTIPVGIVIKRFAIASSRQEVTLVQACRHIWVRKNVCAAHNSGIDLAPPKSIASHVKRR